MSTKIKLLIIGVVLLLAFYILARFLAPARSYRARCKDCPFVLRSADLQEIKAAALFHNLHSREKGERHQVAIEARR